MCLRVLTFLCIFLHLLLSEPGGEDAGARASCQAGPGTDVGGPPSSTCGAQNDAEVRGKDQGMQLALVLAALVLLHPVSIC